MSTSPSAAEYQALAELRYRVRRFLVFSEEAARAAGLEAQQHQLLLAVKGLPTGLRPTIGVVAERLQIAHHSAVELVDRTVRSGLLRRRRDPEDRRAVLLAVTARGERLLAVLSVAHRDELRSAAPALARALRQVVRSAAPRAAKRPS